MNSELNFLDYRLQVVQQWPESAMKSATLQAIRSRLQTLEAADGSIAPRDNRPPQRQAA